MVKPDPPEKCELRTYNSVASLSATKLKSLCQAYNIDVKFPKKARIVLLCHCLNISTTGPTNSNNLDKVGEAFRFLPALQKAEYERLTIKFLCSQSDWSKDLTKIPDVDESAVKKYLLNTNVLNTSSARTYKLSRPFQLKDFVHSVTYFRNENSETFGVICGLCNPSQATSADDVKVVFVIIDKISGVPYGGFCTCTVGFSQTCGHIGAILFRVADIVATGSTSEQSCTEKLCEWTDPKGSKSAPSVFDDIKVKKSSSSFRRTIKDYGSTVSSSKPPSYDDVARLRASLFAATHHLRQYCPAVHIIYTDRFKHDSKPPVPLCVTSLPEHLPFDSQLIAYSNEEIVKTTPMSVIRLQNAVFNFQNDPRYSQKSEDVYKKACQICPDPAVLEESTRGQASNSQWHEQRRGSVTATKFAAVVKWANDKTKKCGSLVSDIIGDERNIDKLKNIPAVKWGRKHEPTARSAYTNKFERWHKDFKVEESGLLVLDECNFVRGSPDGIVSCACHGSRLLEIKCPYSARHLTVAEGVDTGKIKYLQKQNGRFVLKQGTQDGYFEQIQGLMGIAKLENANLVVWTQRDFVTVHVPFNRDFFHNQLVPACKDFFKCCIVPKPLVRDSQPDTSSTVVTSVEERSLDTDLSNNKENEGGGITCLTIPSLSQRIKSPERSCAELILSESKTYSCNQCSKVLPETDILPDNSDASVGCDCPNCGGCDIWYCWPCAKYDEEWALEGINWYCPKCTRSCDIIY